MGERKTVNKRRYYQSRSALDTICADAGVTNDPDGQASGETCEPRSQASGEVDVASEIAGARGPCQ